jgi:hypothetical protein
MGARLRGSGFLGDGKTTRIPEAVSRLKAFYFLDFTPTDG